MKLHAVACCNISDTLLIAFLILMSSSCAAEEMKVIEFCGCLRQLAHSYLPSGKAPILKPGAGSLHTPGWSSELSCALGQRHLDFSLESLLQSAFRLSTPEKRDMETWAQKVSLPVHQGHCIIADMMAVCPEVADMGR